MSDYTVASAAEVDEEALNGYLQRVYRTGKSEFLIQHGSWLHRGNENRLVLLSGSRVIGYTALIPTECMVADRREPALWWVDLIIEPEFRGKGLQTMLDERVRSAADLKLGFPNKLAAGIHLRHGWGVREDLRHLLLPLRPRRTKHVQESEGPKRLALQTAAVLLAGPATALRRRVSRFEPSRSSKCETVDPLVIEAVFERHCTPDTVTTVRDRAFARWRYELAPYKDDLAFFVSARNSIPSHYLVARHVQLRGYKVTRILDLFGDFTDLHGIRDIVMLAARDALQQGSSQVTVLWPIPRLRRVFRSMGFLLSSTQRFCWRARSSKTMEALDTSDGYWCLADSDNDSPV